MYIHIYIHAYICIQISMQISHPTPPVDGRECVGDQERIRTLIVASVLEVQKQLDISHTQIDRLTVEKEDLIRNHKEKLSEVNSFIASFSSNLLEPRNDEMTTALVTTLHQAISNANKDRDDRYIYTYIYMYIYIYMFVYLYTCTYIYIYMYIGIEIKNHCN
jgi:hypothetical protein